jgi:hypothetical protein
MKQISKRFGRQWKDSWEGFMQLLGGKPVLFEKVTRVRFVSTDAVARQVLQWYEPPSLQLHES